MLHLFRFTAFAGAIEIIHKDKMSPAHRQKMRDIDEKNNSRTMELLGYLPILRGRVALNGIFQCNPAIIKKVNMTEYNVHTDSISFKSYGLNTIDFYPVDMILQLLEQNIKAHPEIPKIIECIEKFLPNFKGMARELLQFALPNLNLDWRENGANLCLTTHIVEDVYSDETPYDEFNIFLEELKTVGHVAPMPLFQKLFGWDVYPRKLPEGVFGGLYGSKSFQYLDAKLGDNFIETNCGRLSTNEPYIFEGRLSGARLICAELLNQLNIKLKTIPPQRTYTEKFQLFTEHKMAYLRGRKAEMERYKREKISWVREKPHKIEHISRPEEIEEIEEDKEPEDLYNILEGFDAEGVDTPNNTAKKRDLPIPDSKIHKPNNSCTWLNISKDHQFMTNLNDDIVIVEKTANELGLHQLLGEPNHTYEDNIERVMRELTDV
jgi:hypothetical protein